MKQIIIAIIGFVGLAGVFLVIKIITTSSKIADKTIFNPDKHVVSYEQFRDDYQAYLRYISSYCESQKELEKVLSSGRATLEDPYVRTLMLNTDGFKKMALDVAQRYNANAQKFYKRIWKGDLPERLSVNIKCN